MFVTKRKLILVSLLASSTLWLTKSNIQADEVPPTGTISDTRPVQQIGQTGQWRLQVQALSAKTDQLTLNVPAGVQLDSKQVLTDNKQTVAAVKVVNPSQWQITLRDVNTAQVMINYRLTTAVSGQLQLWQQNHLLASQSLPTIQSSSSSSSAVSLSSSSTADSKSSTSQATDDTSTTSSSDTTSQASQSSTSQTPVSRATQASTDSSTNSSQNESSDSSNSNSQSTSPSSSSSNDGQNSSSQATTTLPPAALTSMQSTSSNQTRTHQIVQQQSVGLVGKLPALDFGQVHTTNQKQLIAPVDLQQSTPVGIVDALPTGKHWQLKIQSSAAAVDPAQLVWIRDGQTKSIQTGLTIVTSNEPNWPLIQNGREIARYYPLPWDARTGLRLLLPATANPPLGRHSATLTWTIQQVP